MKTPNVAASVRQRLLTLAQAKNWEFNRVLARYGVERVLCRLAASPHSERFLLKGATLFTVWEGAPHRSGVGSGVVVGSVLGKGVGGKGVGGKGVGGKGVGS